MSDNGGEPGSVEWSPWSEEFDFAANEREALRARVRYGRSVETERERAERELREAWEEFLEAITDALEPVFRAFARFLSE